MGGSPSQVRTGVLPSQVRVGRGYPHTRLGWEYPISGQDGGYPILLRGTPIEVRSKIRTGGTPSQMERYPMPVQNGEPPSQVRSQVRMGVPQGYPHHQDGGSPPPHQQGPHPGTRSGQRGYPHPEQHSVYLLCGGQYVSCVHTGGLSWYRFFLMFYKTISIVIR